MNLLLLSADYPNINSGIGDYSFFLTEKLLKKINVYILTTDNNLIIDKNYIFKTKWNLKSIFKIFKIIKEKKINNVNIQYPCSLFGKYSLIPHYIIIMVKLFSSVKIITTLHEYSNSNIFRRMSMNLFIWFSDFIIVTSQFEKNYIIKKRFIFNLIKNLNSMIAIIPLASNIKKLNMKSNYNSNLIIYFGLFYPGKNIEKVISIMKKIEYLYPKKYVFRFIGGIHPYYKNYFDEIYNLANNNLKNVEFIMNKQIEEISQFIKDAFCSILWFNDGASVRRGSLLGVLINNIPVLTNYGKLTYELAELENKGIFYLNDNFDELDKIFFCLNNKFNYNLIYENLTQNSEKYSFEKVATKYIGILKKLR